MKYLIQKAKQCHMFVITSILLIDRRTLVRSWFVHLKSLQQTELLVLMELTVNIT